MNNLVLINSKDPDFYMLMSHILATAGFCASPIDDADAISTSDIFSIVAVFMDTSDEIESLERFCDRLKSDAATRHIPIIALIRARHEDSYLRLLKAGISEGFVRPVSPARILTYLHDLSGIAPQAATPSSPYAGFRFGDFDVDEQTRFLKSRVARERLTPIEFRLLMRFLKTPGRVLSRKILIKAAWPDGRYVGGRTLDVHIANLRRVLEKTTGNSIIRTVRSSGFVAEIGDDGN